MVVNEGGNVFKGANKEPLTQRINREDVPATIKWLEGATGLAFPESTWLGTTGRKSSSGDLDLSVDESKLDKDTLVQTLLANGLMILNSFLEVYLVPTGHCLFCYECSGQTDCEDPFVYESKYLKNCPPDTKYCMKYRFDGKITRTCLSSCQIPGFYCCQTDGCNSAQIRKSNIYYLIVPFIMCLFLR